MNEEQSNEKIVAKVIDKWGKLSKQELEMLIEEKSENIYRMENLYTRLYEIEAKINLRTQQLKTLKKLRKNAMNEVGILFANNEKPPNEGGL